jgi:hypothetical protein
VRNAEAWGKEIQNVSTTAQTNDCFSSARRRRLSIRRKRRAEERKENVLIYTIGCLTCVLLNEYELKVHI